MVQHVYPNLPVGKDFRRECLFQDLPGGDDCKHNTAFFEIILHVFQANSKQYSKRCITPSFSNWFKPEGPCPWPRAKAHRPGQSFETAASSGCHGSDSWPPI